MRKIVSVQLVCIFSELFLEFPPVSIELQLKPLAILCVLIVVRWRLRCAGVTCKQHAHNNEGLVR